MEDHGPTALSAFRLICTACKPELLAIVDSAGTKAAAATSARPNGPSPRPDQAADPNPGVDADTEGGRHEAAAAAASNEEARVEGHKVVDRVLDTAASAGMVQAAQPGTLDAQLRPYQRQALHWLVTRESGGEDRDAQQREMQRVAEELWHVRDAGTRRAASPGPHQPPAPPQPCKLHSGGEVYANPYRRVVAVEPPPPPRPCFGGLLCDEMGMGKTVELLALLHARMEGDRKWRASGKGKGWIESRPGGERARSTAPRRRRAGTLVVAPMSMLAQWRDEIATHSRPDSLRVLVHYGAERAGGASDAFTRADVVLTTYGVVCSEMGAVTRGAPSRLHAPRWGRVVLDEAHLIKNKNTETARAVYALHAEHRWCLTGTPLQFAPRALPSTRPRRATHRSRPQQLAHGPLLPPPLSAARAVERVHLVEAGDHRPVRGRPARGGNGAHSRPAWSPCASTHQGHARAGRAAHPDPPPSPRPRHPTPVLRRRTRLLRRPVLQVQGGPRWLGGAATRTGADPRPVSVQAEFEGFVAEGTARNKYATIFTLLLRLRQACNHPFLVMAG